MDRFKSSYPTQRLNEKFIRRFKGKISLIGKGGDLTTCCLPVSKDLISYVSQRSNLPTRY